MMELLAPLNAYLVAQFGPTGPMMALVVLGGLMIAAVLPALVRRKPDPLDRLHASAGLGPQREVAKTPERAQLRLDAGNDKLEKFAGFLEPQTAEEMSEAMMRMTRAGYRGKNAVRTFHAAQFALGIAFLALGVAYSFLTSTGEVSTTTLLMSVLLPGGFGYYLPKYWVERRIQVRREEIQNGFPDALDLLLVCVEAGQSLDQGIIRVSKELAQGYPALAEEFAMIAHEIKAGKDKIQVLRGFGDRVAVPDVNSFVTVMIQSQTFGTSIADALRVYASDMRDKRVMRAEEAANKIPTKMTLGTMMFTVPPLLIILVGPSVHDMLDTFDKLNSSM